MLEVVLGMKPSIIIPSLSLFIQIICYQGIVFEQINFLFYQEFPRMNFTGEKGLFGDFERWDILIMLDVVLFLSNLLIIFIFVIGSVFPGQFLMEKHLKGMNKDFMEGNIESKKFLIQVNSLAIANSLYLYLIFVDDFQRDLKI